MRTIKQFLLAACGLASLAAFVVHADSAAALEKAITAIKVGGPTSPDGQAEVTCDLPVSERKQNIASRGLGCCVFRSMDHAARWQGVPQLVGFPEWMVKKGIPGGGYPAKVKELIERISKDRGMEAPGYLQYEGKNPSVLREAIASGRMPGVTYNGHDPHYAGTIAHMVNLVHLDDRRACILTGSPSPPPLSRKGRGENDDAERVFRGSSGKSVFPACHEGKNVSLLTFGCQPLPERATACQAFFCRIRRTHSRSSHGGWV